MVEPQARTSVSAPMPSTLPAIPPLPLARALPSAPLPWCLWRCSVHTSHAPRSICWSPPSWTPRCVTFGVSWCDFSFDAAGAVWCLHHLGQDRPARVLHPGPQGALLVMLLMTMMSRFHGCSCSQPSSRASLCMWCIECPASLAHLSSPLKYLKCLLLLLIAGVCGPAGGCHAALLVQRHDHEVCRQGRPGYGGGGAQAVQHHQRTHGGHRKARLQPLREDLHRLFPEGDDPPW